MDTLESPADMEVRYEGNRALFDKWDKKEQEEKEKDKARKLQQKLDDQYYQQKIANRIRTWDFEAAKQELKILRAQEKEALNPTQAELFDFILNSYDQIKSLSRSEPVYHLIERKIHIAQDEIFILLASGRKHAVLLKKLEEFGIMWMVLKYANYIALNIAVVQDSERKSLEQGHCKRLKLAAEWSVIAKHIEEDEAEARVYKENLWKDPHNVPSRFGTAAYGSVLCHFLDESRKCHMWREDWVKAIKLYQHYDRGDDLADYVIVDLPAKSSVSMKTATSPKTNNDELSPRQPITLPTALLATSLTDILKLDDCREIATFILRERFSLKNWTPPSKYNAIKEIILEAFGYFQRRCFDSIPYETDPDTELVSATDDWKLNENWTEKMDAQNTARRNQQIENWRLECEASEIEGIRKAGGLTDEQDEELEKWEDRWLDRWDRELEKVADRMEEHIDDMWEDEYVPPYLKMQIVRYLAAQEVMQEQKLGPYSYGWCESCDGW